MVASEVRRLALHSGSAEKEVKELIVTSVFMIQYGAKQAMAVGATMGQVKQAVVQMDTVTQQNAALVE